VVVELSRNFGQQAAMSAGLAQARGAAVVIIDADLQDPPEVIPEMVRAWRSGVDVAYGRRRSREGETRFKLVTASLFHRLFASLVPHPIPVDTGDFKLIDRAVVDAVCSLPERRRYLRSLVPWAGFRHEPVWYDRHARAAGETKYSARKLIMLAADALVISSDAPVRLTWACSLSLTVIGLSAAAVAPAPHAAPTAAGKVTATAVVDGREVVKELGTLGELKLAEKPKVTVAILPGPDASAVRQVPGEPLTLLVRPGSTTAARVKAERHDFPNRIEVGNADAGRNLPHGVYVDNIGLNGLLIVEGQTEREFFITASPVAKPGRRLFHLKAGPDGGQCSTPVLVEVLPPDTVAGR
jgi:hypothetical protein